MRHFKNPIYVREEFFYEVMLPFLGSKKWQYDLSGEQKPMHITLLGLMDDAGKEHIAATAKKLIQRLQKGARLSPFYVYTYKGTYDERLDGHWRCLASPDLLDANELAEVNSEIPNMGTVRIYASAEVEKPRDWHGKVKGRYPYKVRAVQLHGYFDMALLEIDCQKYDSAVSELMSVLDDTDTMAAIYMCIWEWSAHGSHSG